MPKELKAVSCTACDKNGIVRYDENIGEFICDSCGALYQYD